MLRIRQPSAHNTAGAASDRHICTRHQGLHHPTQGLWYKKMTREQAGGVQGSDKPGTKAIVFSQFWMHIELVVHFLATRSVSLALLKRNLSPADKAAALARFQVLYPGLPLGRALHSSGRCFRMGSKACDLIRLAAYTYHHGGMWRVRCGLMYCPS